MIDLPEVAETLHPQREVTRPGTATVVIDAPHGTLAGYRSWGCHCIWCTAAERAATPIVSAAGKS